MVFIHLLFYLFKVTFRLQRKLHMNPDTINFFGEASHKKKLDKCEFDFFLYKIALIYLMNCVYAYTRWSKKRTPQIIFDNF